MAEPQLLKTRDGQEIPVPPDGSLGLMALGYRGIMLWRQARAKAGWTPAKAAALARKLGPKTDGRPRDTDVNHRDIDPDADFGDPAAGLKDQS